MFSTIRWFAACACQILLCVMASNAMAASDATDKANRLLNEPSPYLRQHAYNPVDWYPWGEEAFAKARRENKPILLSVGYATCHWCHVMERESYSDKEIAKILNTSFVSIKVDRERRPEIDEIYILATQVMTQQGGGWPNNVILTPQLLPFFGGVYFPRDDFEQILRDVSLQWATNRGAIEQEGQRVGALIDRIMSHRTAAQTLSPDVIKKAMTAAISGYDVFHGGIGQSAKFPRESLLLFLLDQAEKHGNQKALEVATLTLDNMIQGGIHDHIGGGFHRYTVDPSWTVPHFEKMLYNQAGIGRALVQAYRITGERRYAETAQRLMDFVLRDMQAPAGGFFSAFDADSKGGSEEAEEGLFYIWTPEDLAKALTPDDAKFAAHVFGVTERGNFEGQTVLRMDRKLSEVASAFQLSISDAKDRVERVSNALRDWREKNREAPFRDDKVLTSWNGSMISALAEAGEAFNDPRYIDAARKASEFFWTKMGADEGKLWRQFYDGQRTLEATQEGYVLLALGYLSLYDASGETVWLERAKQLAAAMHKKFYDKTANNYFMTAKGSGFYRPKINNDGDLPSGNAAAVDLFARLAVRDLDPEHRASAEATMASISGNAVEQPESNAYALRAADQLLRGETGYKHYLAKGRVQATAKMMKDGTAARVHLRIAEGWHVNANQPLEDAFIPTVIESVGASENAGLTVAYPKPLKRKLGFHDDVLALYEGEIDAYVKAQADAPIPKKLAITVQACSDRICLEPETLTLPILTN